MKTIPVFEAKNKLSELITIAERGEEVSITRRGIVVARLIAADKSDDGVAARRQRIRNALARLRELRESIEIEGDLKQMARQGLD